ncbi:hypothetical protein, partial [Dysgonomonas capnocytophagoides]
TVTTTRYKYAVDEYGEIYLTGKTVTMKEYSADEKTLKMAMAKEGEVEEKVENMPQSWEIIVQNQEAAEQIELLRFPGTEEEKRERCRQIEKKYAARDTDSDSNAYDPSLG